MGVAEVEKFIAQSKKDGILTDSLEHWLAIQKGEIKKEKRKPTKEVLEYTIGDIVSWEDKGKTHIGKVCKLNLVTVGVREPNYTKWNIAPCYLKKIPQ